MPTTTAPPQYRAKSASLVGSPSAPAGSVHQPASQEPAPAMTAAAQAVVRARRVAEAADRSQSCSRAAPIGTITILTMSIIIPKKSIVVHRPARSHIQNGVVKGAVTVPMAVRVSDSGRFASAMYDITFEARPLEHAPISTTPAAISGGMPSIFAIPQPTTGMTLNCSSTPIATG